MPTRVQAIVSAWLVGVVVPVTVLAFVSAPIVGAGLVVGIGLAHATWNRRRTIRAGISTPRRMGHRDAPDRPSSDR